MKRTRRLILELSLLAVLVVYLVSQFIPKTIVDPVLLKYDNEFHSIVKKYCKEEQYFHPIQKFIYFQDMGNDYNDIAFCQSNRYTSFKIVYNIKVWKIQDEDQRFSGFVHEATHCYFKEPHSLDPNHYMFAFENNLSKDTVKYQLAEFLKKKCN